MKAVKVCLVFVTRNKFFSKEASSGLSCKMGTLWLSRFTLSKTFPVKRVLAVNMNVVKVEEPEVALRGRLTDIPSTGCAMQPAGIYPHVT